MIENTDLINRITTALEDLKALEILTLDVQYKNSIIDFMIIASGTSSRHVQSIAENLVDKLKEQDIRPRGVNGDTEGEWWLVDVGDIIVHVMHPKTRALYNLEELWDAAYNRHQRTAIS